MSVTFAPGVKHKVRLRFLRSFGILIKSFNPESAREFCIYLLDAVLLLTLDRELSLLDLIDRRELENVCNRIDYIVSQLTKEGDIEFLKCAKYALSEAVSSGAISITAESNLIMSAIGILHCDVTIGSSRLSELYPNQIHIETYAICNAKCSFCEYDNLKRKGVKMSDGLIDKIIYELSAIPSEHSFQVQPYKISEPFLDARLPATCGKILKNLSNSKIKIISNGNFLPMEVMHSLLELDLGPLSNVERDNSNHSRISISFSLNEHSKEKYQSLMKLSYERTIANLKNLHQLLDRLGWPIPVSLTRASTDIMGDEHFRQFSAKEFPGFNCKIFKLNNWLSTNKYSNDILNPHDEPLNSIKKFGCTRWSDLSITASGEVALCCMDSGSLDLNLGNANNSNILELYRDKNKLFVPSTGLRGDSCWPCSSCTYFQGVKTILPQLLDIVNKHKTNIGNLPRRHATSTRKRGHLF